MYLLILSEKVGYKIDCYILHTALFAIILILIITIICYHFAKHRSKQKGNDALTNIKWKIRNFKMFVLKITCVIILKTELKQKIFIDNILIDEKPHENILIYKIPYPT